jgi:SpoIID/LytB domain protein
MKRADMYGMLILGRMIGGIFEMKKKRRGARSARRAIAIAACLAVLIISDAQPPAVNGDIKSLANTEAEAGVPPVPSNDGQEAASEAETRSGGPDVSAADIPVTGSSLNGEARVLLTSLGGVSALELTLAGHYTVEGDPGFRFDEGTVVTVAAEGDDIYLKTGGLIINMGSAMTFTRHEAESESGAENGMYIHGSARDNIYNGHLRLSAGHGRLRPIMLIDLEEYLYGVVPYEMSDSFPADALKAQAVAARTYAVRRMEANRHRDHDLVDTTQDQVFFGYDPKCENAIAAVDQTRGVCGMYKGRYAACYYAASNGGQTALPTSIWGGGGGEDFGYFQVTDDPFDLENPASVKRAYSFSAEFSKIAEPLASMLAAQASAALTSMGYSGEAEDFEIRRVAAIEPTAPKFEQETLMCTLLRFSLAVNVRPKAAPSNTPQESGMDSGLAGSVREAAPDNGITEQADLEPLEKLLTVDLTVYKQIKHDLGLSINVADVEIVSIEARYAEPDMKEEPEESALPAETEAPIPANPNNRANADAPLNTPLPARSVEPGADRPRGEPEEFTIVMRRFGHGVGMSQRGAEWMASRHRMNYIDILNFYYPGMDLKASEFIRGGLLEKISSIPESLGIARARATPRPTQAPLPPLSEGEYYADVNLASRASSLNVRKNPSLEGEIVGALYPGERVIVAGKPAEGWCQIKTAEFFGYVAEEYLIAADE